ncbi:transcriptional regulator FeaR [Halomonas icarae]|uniref:Transcriptional regulator FeaR n=1 Tax=Halomonas icarae TaxID=2691040 RepID=A0A7X4W1M6_9GAMM|nr:transcriptional regulator FeaR [Halomonas icarae]MDR5903392.1 transcriptional regulator FeaR [Halomonas icarae]NAW14246.1 transcriptional regulator FeaR [Halomonas icarae]
MASLSPVQPVFSHWLTSLRQVCGNFDAQPPSGMPFFGDVKCLTSVGLEVAEITTNAKHITRRRLNADNEDDRHCFLILQRRGRAEIYQNGRSTSLNAGEMALVDSVQECEILPYGLIDHASFHLPRQDVLKRLDKREVPFGKLRIAGPSGDILQMMMSRILSLGPGEVDKSEGEALCAAMIALLRAQDWGQTHPEEDMNTAEHLYRSAKLLIDQQLQDTDLSPNKVAIRLNISVRQLYRVFETQAETVARYIQRRRLERSAEALTCSAQAHRSITDIAFEWGFTDSAHFSRAFKKAFGQSPRDYRHHYYRDKS